MQVNSADTQFRQALDVAASVGVGVPVRCPESEVAAIAPVAVASLYPAVAQGLVAVLGAADLLESNEAALLKWARRAALCAARNPLLLVDASASEGGLLTSVREALPEVRIILIFEDLGREQLDLLLNCSARGCVGRQTRADDLMRAVQAVQAGQLWVPRAWLTGLYELAAGAWVPCGLEQPVTESFGADTRSEKLLTGREMGALELAHQGLTNKEIARLLHISGSTVKKHLAHAYEKLGIRHRRQLYSAR